MKKNRAVVQSIWVLAGVILLVFLGCGKKGPPLPPEVKGQFIAAPFDLKLTRDDKNIALSWKHQIDKKTAFVNPQGFDIFMAKKTVDACEGCPFVFERVGFVSMPSKNFMIEIEKGFQYYFRVQATGENNMRSDFSKTVQFEYP